MADYDIWGALRRRMEERMRRPARKAVDRFERRHRDAIAVLRRAGHEPVGRHVPDGSGPHPMVNVWLECARCRQIAHTGPSGHGLTGPMTRGECPASQSPSRGL